MKKSILLLLFPVLILSACGNTGDTPEFSSVPETTISETTSASAEAPTQVPTEAPTEEVPQTTAPKEEEPVSSEPTVSPLQPGYYLISSVGTDGNVSFYSTMDPENGYLELREDGTGTMRFDGAEAELTWDKENVTWNGQALTGVYLTYFDSELDRNDSMLVLYFLEEPVSVIFRPAQAPAE